MPNRPSPLSFTRLLPARQAWSALGGLPAVVHDFWIQLIQKSCTPIESHPHSPAVARGPADARTCPFSVVAGCTGPRYSRLGYALMAFCRCPLFSEALRKEWTLSALPPVGPVVRLSPPLSLWGTKCPVTTLCACALESWRAFGLRGVAPVPRFLICVQSGAVPTLASAGAGPCLSTGATFVACILVLWRHGPGVVHVQRPGRWVAGWGLRRRVRLVAVV